MSLPLPRSEFIKRREKARKLAAEKDFDSLLIIARAPDRPGHVRYLTNYYPPLPSSANGVTQRGRGYAALLLPVREKSILVTDVTYYQKETIVAEDILSNSNWTLALINAIKARKLQNATIGIAGTDLLPTAYLEDLKMALPTVKFKNADELLWALRFVKSEQEITLMQQAAKVADNAINVATQTLQEGITEREVAAAIGKMMMENGVEFISTLFVQSGKGSTYSLRWPPATNRKLRRGDMILMDFVASMETGYWLDITRTTILGNPTNKQREIFERVLEANRLALKTSQPGIPIEAIKEAIKELSEEPGYTGHGLGLELEPPYIVEGDKTILKPGMILCIEPGFYDPKIGGARIEDEILITETGARYLTKFERKLW